MQKERKECALKHLADGGEADEGSTCKNQLCSPRCFHSFSMGIHKRTCVQHEEVVRLHCLLTAKL